MATLISMVCFGVFFPFLDSCFNLLTMKLLCFGFFPVYDADASVAADGSVPNTLAAAAANGMLPSLFSLSSC